MTFFGALLHIASIPFRFAWWWIKLPFRVIKAAFKYAVEEPAVIAVLLAAFTCFMLFCMVCMMIPHDPSNHWNPHMGPGGFLGYMIVGFGNFEYWAWEALNHYGTELIHLPREMRGVHDPLGRPLGFLFNIFMAKPLETFFWWASNYGVTAEHFFGAIGWMIFIAVASAALTVVSLGTTSMLTTLAGIIGAAAKSAGGGHKPAAAHATGGGGGHHHP